MFLFSKKKNTIKSIALRLPVLLVESYTRQANYSVDQVKEIFAQAFDNDDNQIYAFAMFCSRDDFDALQTEFNYTDLRAEVGKHCFDDWPRFNFESLLTYARSYYSDSGFSAGVEGDFCGGGEGGGD
ncbi:DUF6559 family protein [Pseudoalteromonas rubra]|uniref:Uncharacterized protein n=1 Tax=Pseudoalteromonas rubra TaxID=43658 RepID=A0A5S3X726_9GAMM|nr:DUF6559 family protein [Pseudoalteromonas rubra]TMP39533.1 hypothetical protein CWB98_02795 [Pseudoalteromonas rubra]